MVILLDPKRQERERIRGPAEFWSTVLHLAIMLIAKLYATMFLEANTVFFCIQCHFKTLPATIVILSYNDAMNT